MRNVLLSIVLAGICLGCDNLPFDLPLTEGEIIGGLKEALTIGSGNAASLASVEDGFFRNQAIKILLPPEAQEIKDALKSPGLLLTVALSPFGGVDGVNGLVNEFELKMNRAAEEAAKGAATIFVEAVRNMTIEDGLSILQGSDTAAMHFLRVTTTEPLRERFTPTVQAAMSTVKVADYWEDLVLVYNLISDNNVNPNLDQYITNKAIGGLMTLIGEEEKKIRTDPAAQVTELLKKVFGRK